jgi:hypothetical protein
VIGLICGCRLATTRWPVSSGKTRSHSKCRVEHKCFLRSFRRDRSEDSLLASSSKSHPLSCVAPYPLSKGARSCPDWRRAGLLPAQIFPGRAPAAVLDDRRALLRFCLKTVPRSHPASHSRSSAKETWLGRLLPRQQPPQLAPQTQAPRVQRCTHRRFRRLRADARHPRDAARCEPGQWSRRSTGRTSQASRQSGQ